MLYRGWLISIQPTYEDDMVLEQNADKQWYDSIELFQQNTTAQLPKLRNLPQKL